MRGNSNFGNKNRGNRQFGRGGYNRHGSQNRHFKQNSKPFIPHVLFDFIQVEHAFQRVRPISVDDDKVLNDALVKRSQDLTPGSNETNQLLNTVTKIQTIVENLIASPVESYQIDEVRQVGSFKKGTILVSNRLTADIAIVLKTLPTREAVNALAQKVLEELKRAVSNPIEINNLHLSLNESGFEIFSASFVGSNAIDLVVQVLITTQYQNIRKLDSSLHLDSKQCQISLASVKHAKWFEEKVTIENIKILIRLFRDIRSRFDGLTPLSPWIIDLIAHYAVTNNPKHEPLSLVVAFKRIFQLISAGIFLPGSAGIIDPCEHAPTRVHTTMNLEQQDSVCFTFQTLFRVLSHGGFRQILGLEGNSSIATSPSVWAGIVIIPSSKAYEPSLDQQFDDKEDDLNKEDEQMISDENVKIDTQMNNSVE